MIASYSWSSVSEFILLTFPRNRSPPEMNKSSFVALSLGLLAVLSCLDLAVHGKPASPCCKMKWSCCQGRFQDSSMSARVKRRTQAMAVKYTLLGNFHDARAEVEHPGVQNHWRVLLQSLNYKPQTVRRREGKLALVNEHLYNVLSFRWMKLTPVRARWKSK